MNSWILYMILGVLFMGSAYAFDIGQSSTINGVNLQSSTPPTNYSNVNVNNSQWLNNLNWTSNPWYKDWYNYSLIFNQTITDGLYWKRDGSSTATGNWNITPYNITSPEFTFENGGRIYSESNGNPILDSNDGNITMNATQTLFRLGTAGNPSISFISENDTGLFANTTSLGFTVARRLRGSFSAGGLELETDLGVPYGGTGASSFDARGVIIGGTTTTGALRSVALALLAGATGVHYLTYNGVAGTDPAWSTVGYPATSTINGSIMYTYPYNAFVVDGSIMWNRGVFNLTWGNATIQLNSNSTTNDNYAISDKTGEFIIENLNDGYTAFQINGTGRTTISAGATKTVVVDANLNITGNLSVKRPYWTGYDNSTQNFHNTANAQVINISNNLDYDNYGIYVVGSQNLTFDKTGDYICVLSPEFFQSSGGSALATFWIQKNGVDVKWSNSRYTVPNNAYNAPSITYQFDITAPATDNIRFMWWSDSTNTQLYSSGALTSPTRPSIPAVLLNCQKVSEIT